MRDQHLARFLSFSVRSWIALRYLFFSNGFEINLLYSQLSLNKHLFRRTTLDLVLTPVIVQSFDYNYALYKTETPQRRTTDTFNGAFRSALGQVKNTAKRKCRCTTWQYKLQLG